MCQTAQRSFNAPEDDRNIGKQLLDNLCIDDCRVFGAQVVATVGTVSVLGAKTASSGVFVHHGIHAPRGNAEPQAWTTEFLEIAEIAVPVGLRNDDHAQAFGFQYATDDSHAERGMIDVGIAREQDDIGLLPAAQIHFLASRG